MHLPSAPMLSFKAQISTAFLLMVGSAQAQVESNASCAPGSAGLQCIPCPIGTIPANATLSIAGIALEGARSCDPCPRGTYQPYVGGLVCQSCSYPSSSSVSSDGCFECTSPYYSNPITGQCDLCDENAYCAGGAMLPVPRSGYWLDRAALSKFVSIKVIKCWRGSCTGGLLEGGEIARPECWLPHGIGNTTCEDDSILCAPNSGTPLCQTCHPGFGYKSGSKACVPCEEIKPTATGYIIVAYITVACACMWWLDRLPRFVRKSRIVAIHSYIDVGSLKIVQSFLQIMYMMTNVLNVQYPIPYSRIIDLMASYSDESKLLSETCRKNQPSTLSFEQNFDTNTVSSNAAIFITCLLILGIGYIRVHYLKATKSTDGELDSRIDIIHQQHYFVAFMVLWNFLPIAVLMLSRAFDCVQIQEDYKVVRADTTTTCEDFFSNTINGDRNIVRYFICACLLLPMCVWLGMLYPIRSHLNPAVSKKDDDTTALKLALFHRSRDRKVKPYLFLFNEYKPQHYWFECYIFYQRFALSSLLLFVPTAGRAAVGTLVSLISIFVAAEVRPFIRRGNQGLYLVTQCAILSLFFYAVVWDSGLLVGLEDTLGLILFGLVISIVLCVFVFARKEERKRDFAKKAKFLAVQSTIEWAVGFSDTKMNTSLEAIAQTSLPASHSLVYYFCSVPAASRALSSGIPAVSGANNESGIVFSVRPFHELSTRMRSLLAVDTADVMLTISLLTDLLDPVASSGEDYAVHLSSRILSAMRPYYFGSVIEPGPWTEGQLLLPPQCILRAYQLKEQSFTLAPCINDRMVPRDQPLFETPRIARQAAQLFCPRTSEEFLKRMAEARRVCSECELVCCYHYTSEAALQFILDGGFRMSSNGQGDGGVYFSTMGPSSYGLGTVEYEKNIITDCFGAERLEEYRGKHKLDVCIVYACERRLLEMAPGGRTNAKMVTKTAFKDFSLPFDNMYFLRPDRILCSFLIDPSKQPYVVDAAELAAEVVKDSDVRLSIGVQVVSNSKWTPLSRQASRILAEETGDEDLRPDAGSVEETKCIDQRSSIALTELFESDSKSFLPSIALRKSRQSITNVLTYTVESLMASSMTASHFSSSPKMAALHEDRHESLLELKEISLDQQNYQAKNASNRQQQGDNSLLAPTRNNAKTAAALPESPEQTWRNPLVVDEHAEISSNMKGDLPIEELNI